MSETLRELAAQHPELLTVECECHGTPIAYRSGDRWISTPCWICGSLGRRLKTVGELLETAAERQPNFAQQSCLARCEMPAAEPRFEPRYNGFQLPMAQHPLVAALLRDSKGTGHG
jgi:hypothetical protein